jgi:hypothetical protein
VDVVRLTTQDCSALAARYEEHGNSHRRMAAALREAGAAEALERLRALRRLEHHFDVDLGSFCHRFRHRDDAETHPIERWLLHYIAREDPAPAPDGAAPDVWLLLDRLREVRQWMKEGGPAPPQPHPG